MKLMLAVFGAAVFVAPSDALAHPGHGALESGALHYIADHPIGAALAVATVVTGLVWRKRHRAKRAEHA